MGDMVYLAAGYAVIWLVAFGFIFSMVSRQRKLEKDMSMLAALVQSDSNDE